MQLTETLRDRAQRKAVGEVIESHSLSNSRDTSTIPGSASAKEAQRLRSKGNRAPSLLHALSKAGLTREQPVVVTGGGTNCSDSCAITGGKEDACITKGLAVSARKSHHRRDVSYVLFPPHTDPTLPPAPPRHTTPMGTFGTPSRNIRDRYEPTPFANC